MIKSIIFINLSIFIIIIFLISTYLQNAELHWAPPSRVAVPYILCLWIRSNSYDQLTVEGRKNKTVEKDNWFKNIMATCILTKSFRLPFHKNIVSNISLNVFYSIFI